MDVSITDTGDTDRYIIVLQFVNPQTSIRNQVKRIKKWRVTDTSFPLLIWPRVDILEALHILVAIHISWALHNLGALYTLGVFHILGAFHVLWVLHIL